MSSSEIDALPPALLAIAGGVDAVQDALRVERAHTFNDLREAPVWIILTDAQIIEAAAHPDDAEPPWTRAHPRQPEALAHARGWVRDTLRVGEVTYDLAVGAGKRAQALVALLTTPPPAPDAPGEAEEVPEADEVSEAHGAGEDAPTLTRLNDLWWEAPDDPTARAIDAALDEDDAVIGLLAITPAEALDGADALWLLVTTCRAALVITRGAEVTIEALDDGAPLRVERATIGRDSLMRGEVVVGYGPRLGGGRVRQLVALAARQPADRALEVALALIDAARWAEAHAALVLADHLVTDADARAEDPEALSLRERIWRRRAQVARALEQEQETLDALVSLTRARPEDDLVQTTAAVGLRGQDWLLILAMSHEQAGDHVSAASVYARLSDETPGGQLFVLQQARCLREAGLEDEALEQYARFIDQRAAQQDMELLAFYAERADRADGVGSDPDLVSACLERGALLEALRRPAEAAAVYLRLIRLAPLEREGYARLFALDPEVVGSNALLGRVREMLALLSPSLHDALTADDGPALTSTPAPLPITYGALTAEEHDAHIRHQAERDAAAVAQRWLGQLVTDPRQTDDIERHCQRVTSRGHPELDAMITGLSHLLGIPAPRVFLSHGMTGAQLLARDRDPFVLLGAAHLDPEHPQHLSTRQLCFVLGAQLEHIRADHLVLTSSEFWGAFGSRALGGVGMLLSLIPVGGALGKVTERWLGTIIEEARKRWDNQALRGIIGYVESSLRGKTSDGLQSAYEATLGRMVQLAGWQQRDDRSLLKEQLASFARGAMYTSDRLGLLACDSLTDAVVAIMQLSERASRERSGLETFGLVDVLSRRDERGALVYTELALRFGELFKFALSDEYEGLRRACVAPEPAALLGQEE